MSNSATIIESSGKVVDHSGEAGIFSCLFEHEIKATKAEFNWTGPKITDEQWAEMLAFFQWTYDNHKSEAQVRLFAHPELGWKIWAFPQAGGTSLTTKEVDNEDSRIQRAAIPEGYVPFGTVHHHCALGAFQSGTDTHDEHAVDGLHITVGKIDEQLFDIHCRLYVKKNKFDPKMNAFWDVGDEAREKADWLVSLKYNAQDVLDREARAQMCIPAPAGTTFPELWKTNYILPAATTNGLVAGPWCWHCQKHTAAHTPDNCPNKDKDSKKGRRGRKHRTVYGGPVSQATTDWWDEKTWEDLMLAAKDNELTDLEVAETLTALGGPEASPFIQEVLELASDNYCTMAKLYELAVKKFDEAGGSTKTAAEQIEEDITKAEQEALEEQQAKHDDAKKTQEEIVEIFRGQRAAIDGD